MRLLVARAIGTGERQAFAERSWYKAHVRPLSVARRREGILPVNSSNVPAMISDLTAAPQPSVGGIQRMQTPGATQAFGRNAKRPCRVAPASDPRR